MYVSNVKLYQCEGALGEMTPVVRLRSSPQPRGTRWFLSEPPRVQKVVELTVHNVDLSVSQNVRGHGQCVCA